MQSHSGIKLHPIALRDREKIQIINPRRTATLMSEKSRTRLAAIS